MNKINTTHLNATNYWTPLQLDEDENEEEEEEEVNKIELEKNNLTMAEMAIAINVWVGRPG